MRVLVGLPAQPMLAREASSCDAVEEATPTCAAWPLNPVIGQLTASSRNPMPPCALTPTEGCRCARDQPNHGANECMAVRPRPKEESWPTPANQAFQSR